MAKVGVARGNDRPREAQGVLEGVSHFSPPPPLAPLLQRTACNTAKQKREWELGEGGAAKPRSALAEQAAV